MLNRPLNIFIPIVLIIVLGFAVYSNSLNGKFIWDDKYLITNNVYTKNWSRLPEIFTKTIGSGSSTIYPYYRPILMLTLMIDYSLWGPNVVGYHVVTIVFHLLVALCIFWLVNILFKDRLLSFLTGAFFVVHPVHTEDVAYITGRSDSLTLLFMLLCFIYYIKFVDSKRILPYVFVLTGYVLALLSKENALILPALILLYHYNFRRKIDVKIFLPLVIITSGYIFLRGMVLKSSLVSASYLATTHLRIPGFFVAITNYVRLLFLPFHLHIEYGSKLFQLTNPKAITGILITLTLLIYAFRCSRRHCERPRTVRCGGAKQSQSSSHGIASSAPSAPPRNDIELRTSRLAFFAIGWFFIALIPYSNIYPASGYMAERYLYVPSIGFFLMLASGLSFLYKKSRRGLTPPYFFYRAVGIFSIAGLLAFYSFLTIRQNHYWRDPITFFERTLKYAPPSANLYTNLGLIYRDMGQSEKAIPLFKKAIEINPRYAKAYNNLGTAYRAIGKAEKSIPLFKKAIELNPKLAYAYYNLAVEHHNIGRFEEAIPLFKRAIELSPNCVPAYNNLGITYSGIGKEEQAIEWYKKAMKIDPKFAEAYYNLGITYYNLGRKKEAIPLFEKTVEVNPNNAAAYNNLGIIYRDMGKKEGAILLLKKAIETDPTYDRAYNNLIDLYLKLGKKEEAVLISKKLQKMLKEKK